MFRSLYRHPTGAILTDLDRDQLRLAACDKRGVLWVDMQAPSDQEFSLVLEETFQFHPLAVEDVVSDVHAPKLDDYGAYLFIVFHTVSLGDEKMDIHTDEIDVFLSSHFLVTVHDVPRSAIDRLWQEVREDIDGLRKGPSTTLYTLLDRQVDAYIPLIDRFEERLEQLGDEIFQMRQPENKTVLNNLLTAKSSALRLRRILNPQRDLLNRLSHQDYAVIPPESRIYFRDVYDHLARLADLADSTRDLATMTIETYLVLVNNRMNEIMKVLTIIATIFMPLGFLAAVYGMNFDFMPELHLRWAYPFIWMVFVGIAGVMVWYFVRRRWM